MLAVTFSGRNSRCIYNRALPRAAALSPEAASGHRRGSRTRSDLRPVATCLSRLRTPRRASPGARSALFSFVRCAPRRPRRCVVRCAPAGPAGGGDGRICGARRFTVALFHNFTSEKRIYTRTALASSRTSKAATEATAHPQIRPQLVAARCPVRMSLPNDLDVVRTATPTARCRARLWSPELRHTARYLAPWGR